MSRLDDVELFYQLMDKLEEQTGGQRLLQDFSQYRDWPMRGLYLFFEPGERRSDTGEGDRIVRIGTHALTSGSRSTLRQRLGQHRGSSKGGGNHRGSIFRLLIGQALLARGDLPPCPSWGVKGDLTKAADALNAQRDSLKIAEEPVEQAVSKYIGHMPFLWLDISDESSPQSQRGYIERNTIALLSNCGRNAVDPASATWLGKHSNRPLVRNSGLWNQRHVSQDYDPAFLQLLKELVGA